MKSPAAIAFVIALVTLSSPSVMAGSRMQPHPLLGVEMARYQAMIAADREALATFLSDDLVYIHSNGIRENKVQFLDAVEAGDIRYLSIQPLETQVRDQGRWAVLTGAVRMTVHTGGRQRSADLFFTAVYERVHRQWQLSSWQTTQTDKL